MQRRLEATWEEERVPQMFEAVILYDDMSAGKKGMQLVGRIDKELGDAVAVRTQPWRVDFLQDAEWSALAMIDALRADLVIVSTSRASTFSIMLESWILSYCARKRAQGGAIVALAGTTENLVQNKRIKVIRSAALEAGLDFFAPQALEPGFARVVNENANRKVIGRPACERGRMERGRNT
jgi:hypothetical protein